LSVIENVIEAFVIVWWGRGYVIGVMVAAVPDIRHCREDCHHLGIREEAMCASISRNLSALY